MPDPRSDALPSVEEVLGGLTQAGVRRPDFQFRPNGDAAVSQPSIRSPRWWAIRALLRIIITGRVMR